MGRATITAQTTPATPASGKVTVFPDSADSDILKKVDDTGTVTSLEGGNITIVTTSGAADPLTDLGTVPTTVTLKALKRDGETTPEGGELYVSLPDQNGTWKWVGPIAVAFT